MLLKKPSVFGVGGDTPLLIKSLSFVCISLFTQNGHYMYVIVHVINAAQTFTHTHCSVLQLCVRNVEGSFMFKDSGHYW